MEAVDGMKMKSRSYTADAVDGVKMKSRSYTADAEDKMRMKSRKNAKARRPMLAGGMGPSLRKTESSRLPALGATCCGSSFGRLLRSLDGLGSGELMWLGRL